MLHVGASWANALPQLALLAVAVTASTLSVLTAQTAALKIAQALQGSSADAVSSPDLGAAARADASDAQSSSPSTPVESSSPLLRLWQSANRALQPVVASGWQKLWNRQASVVEPAKQGDVGPAVSDVHARQEPSSRQDRLNPQSSSQAVPGVSDSDHDEWGRLVLHVNGANSSRHGSDRSDSRNGQLPQAKIDERGHADDPGRVLWVRQDFDDQQEQGVPSNSHKHTNSAADATVRSNQAQSERGHEERNGQSVNEAAPFRGRLRHRRFQGKEISREALLDNVE